MEQQAHSVQRIPSILCHLVQSRLVVYTRPLDKLISFEEVKQHIGYNGNLQFEYNALINAIPESWKQEMNDNSMQIETPKEIITEIGALNKLSNIKIRGFFEKKINNEICACRFWKRNLGVNIENYFTLASEGTKETRLRLLHYTFIHNIYPTNILLKKMDIANSNQCLRDRLY